MQKLTITNLGPISKCSIEMRDFMVFTGPQASGKSTIAKNFFYFKYLKNVLFDLVKRSIEKKTLFQSETVEDAFLREARNIFIQSFGINDTVSMSGECKFVYDNGFTVSVKIRRTNDGQIVNVSLDDGIKQLLKTLPERIKQIHPDGLDEIKNFIYTDIFCDDDEVVYIPAGRSLLTMLSSQISYLYMVMDDQQKHMIDYCSRHYIEDVFKVKDFFKMSHKKLIRQVADSVDYALDTKKLEEASQLIGKILCGEYRNIGGEEQLYYSENEFVKLNYASSGQQEAVWITNLLFYYMMGRRKTCFIIEEPESHLFPAAQKAITELISLVKNGENKVLITTHSPYVLGSVNNLLYADKIAEYVNEEELNAIIPKQFRMSFDKLGAYFLEGGLIKDISDPEYKDIDHDVIDGVSSEINEAYESMVELKFKYSGGRE